MTKRKDTPAKKRRVTRRQLVEAASRLRVDVNGNPYVVRFSPSQRIEHLLLIISFTMLALTGLPQRYADTGVGMLLLRLFGGIETARQVHHTFALLFALEAAYHLGVFAYDVIIKRQWSDMMPRRSDLEHFTQMIRYNLGKADKRPYFGRYTFEEKAEYWALVWGTAVMGITGVMQWFPTIVTRWLPGSAIPVARAFHSWEAVLAVAAILVWHTYHVVIKTRNKSIFTGIMSIEEMEEEHPAELEYIRWAAAVLKSQQGGTTVQPEASQESPAETPPVPEGDGRPSEAVLAETVSGDGT